MKLAEALQERADLNRRIEQLRYRLSNNVLVQEGEKPLEDPTALLEELAAEPGALILSTGGGVELRPENRAALRALIGSPLVSEPGDLLFWDSFE